MVTISKKYIVNELNQKVAVQLDIKMFEKIERLLEDYVIGNKIKENDSSERLIVSEAKSYYKRLKKSNA